jgi:predicted ATPase
VLGRLGDGAARVLVVEDLHWADDATLELLRFLGRRLARLRLLVVLTYRDEEVGPGHPLRVLLGDLATVPGVDRLALRALSPAAVAALAGPAGRNRRTCTR